MSNRQLGLVVSGQTITVVDADVPQDANSPISVLADDTWSLQKGDRGAALHVIHQRCSNYVAEHRIRVVLVKASATAGRAATNALLGSAEVRGVVIAAAAASAQVRTISKAVLSRTYGDRNIDEYLADDEFWQQQIGDGTLRKTSREAAMLIVAGRAS